MKGLAVQEEWLRACVEWILSEEVCGYSCSASCNTLFSYMNAVCLFMYISRPLILKRACANLSTSSGCMLNFGMSSQGDAFQTVLPGNKMDISVVDSLCR